MTTFDMPLVVRVESQRAMGGDHRSGFHIGKSTLLILLVAALLARIMAMFSVSLLPEEAYYWMYSQHPNLSYFDHPPMIAWVIGLGTTLFGNTEFGVRFVGHLLMLAASLLSYQLGRAWFNRTVGIAAALSLQVIPAYYGTGLIATMDAPLLAFWLLCLVGVTMALKSRNPLGWYIAAIGMGGAMLSKYTGVFLGLGALLAMLGNRSWRRQLLTIHPYLAALLALAIFSPVLLWNYQHEWASFRFQFVDRFAGRSFALWTVLTYFGAQFIVITPLACIVIIWLVMLLPRSRRRLFKARTWFALCFSVPLLAVMTYKSFKYSIHINWTLPAYLALLPLFIHLVLAQWRLSRRFARKKSWMPGLRWTIVLSLSLNVMAMFYLAFLQPRLQLATAFGPWEPLAAVVEEHEDRLREETGQRPLLIANGKYRLASVLAFYREPFEAAEVDPAPASQYITSQWAIRGRGLGYEYWMDPARWLGADCLCIDDNDDLLTEAGSPFESVEVVNDPRLPPDGRYKLFIGRGYQGPRTKAVAADRGVKSETTKNKRRKVDDDLAD